MQHGSSSTSNDAQPCLLYSKHEEAKERARRDSLSIPVRSCRLALMSERKGATHSG